MPTPDKDFQLAQYNAWCATYLENGKAAISLFQGIAKSALLLNGMACVALLYSPAIPSLKFYTPLFLYGIGALCAAISNGCAYITQYHVIMDWDLLVQRIPGIPDPQDWSARRDSHKRLARFFRVLTGILVLASYILFGSGCYQALMELQRLSSPLHPV